MLPPLADEGAARRAADEASLAPRAAELVAEPEMAHVPAAVERAAGEETEGAARARRVPLRVSAAERALLSAALGWPVDTAAGTERDGGALAPQLLAITLTACDSVEAQARAIMAAAADPNVLMRQWMGLATWV
jgi:hypothetical protein